ncbi:MAG TPA: DNA methyltransferase, partial [Phycisphaerae bacterium]|nr:DNA methyltransferase [Phycisphaerae bacterium]
MKTIPAQLRLPFDSAAFPQNGAGREPNGQANRLAFEDRAFHDWYRFVLSFPPHLVNTYAEEFGLDARSVVLDPFCGTGTTVVECKLNGIRAIGLEANPFAHFASSVKIDWQIDPDLLLSGARDVAGRALKLLKGRGIDDSLTFDGQTKDLELKTLDPKAAELLITNSISPLPLHKTLVVLECLREHAGQPYYRHALLALANALVFKISNLHFGPEVGVGKPKADAAVVSAWMLEIQKIASDLRLVAGKKSPDCEAHLVDARQLASVIQPNSVDAVITSPPYPNEKDYTRTTRLESVVLGFIRNKAELRDRKKRLIRSNTRGVYKEDDDDKWVKDNSEIQRIAKEIERRRIELGKTSGFERMYGKVTQLYFGGMARHLSELRTVLRPGAHLAYVVGDQASYLRVMIRTGQLLAGIAEGLGYEVLRL